MRSRQPIAYVVQIDGGQITLNLLDMHRGHVASHNWGMAAVAEVGALIGLTSGARLLVLRVQGLDFAEPREAHRAGIGASAQKDDPLRHLRGVIVGRLDRIKGKLEFFSDSLATPALGAEAVPLTDEEYAAIFQRDENAKAKVTLGHNIRGTGPLRVGLESLLARHVAVLGSSGQGKSCFTAAILQQVIKQPRARVVIFDVNGEYSDALKPLLADRLKETIIGGEKEGAFRIPYQALGRHGLMRLLMPSEKTQRPALAFAIEHLSRVVWFDNPRGAGLVGETRFSLTDECVQVGVAEAHRALQALRSGTAQVATAWPSMRAVSALVSESHCVMPGRNGPERSAFLYGNIAPLITRIHRLVEDPMFTSVVNVDGGPGSGGQLNWRRESTELVESIFGAKQVNWTVHIVNLRNVAHDLMPLVLGSLLELYAHELFRRGQENKIATLLVLEEAHHYLRPVGTDEDARDHALAYERLAKEGRKFGLSLWLSTQRPSEVSSTVLSQCNTWVTFRLASEHDLSAVQSACEWVDKSEVRRIAGLARQNAIVFGGSVSMPTFIRAPEAKPRPRSDDAPFDDWADAVNPEEPAAVIGAPENELAA